MKTMAFEVVDRLFIVVHGAGAPTDDDWVAYLKEVERQGIDRTVQLTFTEGGGPSPTQRRYLGALLDGRLVPVAVMTDSTAIRGMVTALSWFNRRIRAFPVRGLLDALAYLDIPRSRAQLIERKVSSLRRSLGRASPNAAAA